MAHMPDFESEIKRDLGHLFHRGEPPAAPAAVPATAPKPQSQPEVQTMSSPLLADAEKAVTALQAHIGSLLSNPLIDALLNQGLGLVLTPGEVSAVVAFIREIETAQTPKPAQPPAPQAAPAQTAPPRAPVPGPQPPTGTM